jgi:hypothetical protein
MSTMDEGTNLEAAQMRVLELFGAVCLDADNPEVAAQADAALAHLEALLAAPAPATTPATAPAR